MRSPRVSISPRSPTSPTRSWRRRRWRWRRPRAVCRSGGAASSRAWTPRPPHSAGPPADGAAARRPAGHGPPGRRTRPSLPRRGGRRGRTAGRRGSALMKDSLAEQGGRSWPDNPVLVEVWRSGFLESVHRGALVVLGADGEVLASAGDVGRPVLPRSSNKPLQATALLAAGWSPRSGEELAIGAGSHSGEDGHRELVASMLAAVGLGPDALRCPPGPPPAGPAPARGRG